jgi:hypothetical protein
MNDKEYYKMVAAALNATADVCAKYLQKNPNAKYKDADGKERPISFAIDIVRKLAKAHIETAEKE